MWYIKVPNHLHCFFVVMNANESALIIGSKLNPFSCDDEWYNLNWSLKERCTTDDISIVSIGIPVILLFLTRFFEEFEKKSYYSETWIFLKQTITWTRDFLMFLIAYFILSESNSSVKIISISVENDFSPYRRYIFKSRNLFIKYVNKHENRMYIYKYNWKDLNKLFPSDSWLTL